MQDPAEYFKLRPLKAAKVSEISETTAASPVPDGERVNFHIGHPVQDRRLHHMYFRLATGLDFNLDDIDDENLNSLLAETTWDQNHKPQLNLLSQAILKSTPYSPRGGFARNNPGKLIGHLKNWLTEQQQEPLTYDFGEETGRRECILANGGSCEILRTLFHALSKYLVYLPARIMLLDLEIPPHLQQFPQLVFDTLIPDEKTALEQIQTAFHENPERPTFICLGKPASELIRRSLREFSLVHPLFFVELNNAPNHLSLAREAKMLNRVLRILDPSVFSQSLSNTSVSFILGNADFIKILETVQFELKGTPAAPEEELLIHLLEEKSVKDHTPSNHATKVSPDDSLYFGSYNAILANTQLLTERIHRSIDRKQSIIENSISILTEHIERSDKFLQHNALISSAKFDPLLNLNPSEIVERFFENINNPTWHQELTNSFLSVFLKHYSEYDANKCMVISGSARTAMSLLGFHCNIAEIITSDLSWTYEHCFPHVEIVPLSKDLALDDQAIIGAVNKKLERDPTWNGAVILNNPHNASGQIFNNDIVSKLLHWLLKRKITVIDDLSYKDVLPASDLKGAQSLREIALDLQKNGYITQTHLNHLVTVHSLSKTDCFAGARLSVVEILNPLLKTRFLKITNDVQPNIMALLLAYLLYRNHAEDVQTFWILRNQILSDRMAALEEAVNDLPAERNPYLIEIQRPTGSMYPRMVINRLPHGVSLDWLASGLAKRGIGLLPLTAFSRTAEGYELARKSFRLTLGGSDGYEQLFRKTRRVLIDLNRMIGEESTLYNPVILKKEKIRRPYKDYFSSKNMLWQNSISKIGETCHRFIAKRIKLFSDFLDPDDYTRRFSDEYLPDRLTTLNIKYIDYIESAATVLEIVKDNRKNQLTELLESELYKENLSVRSDNFRHRLFDRTVHPTQMYSLKVDDLIDKFIDDLLLDSSNLSTKIPEIASALIEEYLCQNVPITSIEEGDELIHDIKIMTRAEEYARWNSGVPLFSLLSFWGDWDGSTRPSGQGHRLVAAAVLENVTQQANLLNTLLKIDNRISIEPDLLYQVQQLNANKEKFWNLLNKITLLTNQLEKRYQSFLPSDIQMGRLKKIGMRIHITRDPMTALWQHNDRLEKKMLDLRNQRRNSLEYYFALNKSLRKVLHGLIPQISNNFSHPEMALQAGLYRSLLKRFNLTPRIHQNMITSDDQFAIDTTVHNLTELNEISGKYGNPGIVMALQVSMSKQPEALISLDRMLRSHREQVLRDNEDLPLPSIWLIPLFEDIDTLQNLDGYLDKLWEYVIQSRRIDQKPEQRFAEMVCEFFVAGSDLSQQISQPAGRAIYKEMKFKTIKWLAERGLVGKVRIKFGSGEPMQRQGGYYAPPSQETAFIQTKDSRQRMNKNLKASTQKSTEYAKSPLRGVLSSGDFRTFQSTLSEKLRLISTEQRAEFLYNVQESQHFYENELSRVCEPLLETRLQFQTRDIQELERLSYGTKDQQYDKFIEIATRNFRQILYGSEEDVVGLHIISYFISRSMPVLRDRPTVRPSRELSQDKGQKIIERIAQTLPLSRHGSLLRAIGHNRSQTMILGINQLSTGLFRALNEFIHELSSHGDGITLIVDRILPNLPVYEILHTLRIYYDPGGMQLTAFERAFPAGNTAFTVLREDMDSINSFIGLFQKEFLRRHGLDISDFFEGDRFVAELLPTVRPDIAVLLQPDLFNTNTEKLKSEIGGKIEQSWLNRTEQLLRIPEEVRHWRTLIWQLLQEPIFQQVQSFVELALAINSLSLGQRKMEIPFAIEPVRVFRLGSQITDLLRGVSDDSMRQFLVSVVQYLTQLPKTMTEIPIDIVRALRDVERIIQIEEQALSKKEQDLLRFYVLQMARLCGENG